MQKGQKAPTLLFACLILRVWHFHELVVHKVVVRAAVEHVLSWSANITGQKVQIYTWVTFLDMAASL